MQLQYSNHNRNTISKRPIVVDVETTFHNKGSPFDSRNHCVIIAIHDGVDSVIYSATSPSALSSCWKKLDTYGVFIGSNIKFDLHWLINLGYVPSPELRVVDVALQEFILNKQRTPFPSLEDMASSRLGEHKLDVIKTQYWDNGINTDEIPMEILAPYAEQDVVLTWKVWQHQLKQIKPTQQRLISMSHQDLLVLLDMERNGMRYDREGSLEHAKKEEERVSQIQQELTLSHSVPNFNWASNDHLSALLYGGEIVEHYYEPAGRYKTGQRVGQVKLKKVSRVHQLPRIYEPNKGSELAKAGYWSTDEENLLKLRGKNKQLIAGILESKKLQKDISTYLRGLPNQQDKGFYSKDYIYANFNQTVAETGRLSSSKPNLQNLSDNALKYCISRYD